MRRSSNTGGGRDPHNVHASSDADYIFLTPLMEGGSPPSPIIRFTTGGGGAEKLLFYFLKPVA